MNVYHIELDVDYTHGCDGQERQYDIAANSALDAIEKARKLLKKEKLYDCDDEGNDVKTRPLKVKRWDINVLKFTASLDS